MKLCLMSVLTLSALPFVVAAEPDKALETARKEIEPLFAEMQAAANAHDTDRHVAFYARDPSLLFIMNDQAIHGWDALRAKQLEWWNHGKSDVVYTQVGEPDYRMPAPGLVMLTFFLTSRRTLPSGETSNKGFGISALWQRRPEGWRIIYAHESSVQK